MVALSVRALLLMAAAYFLGAALACMHPAQLCPRRADDGRRGAGERRVDPLPEVALRDAQAAAASRRARTARAAPAGPLAGRAATAGARTWRRQRRRASAPQDLKSIQGIDAATEARLNGLGISRYEQIAAWMRADVDRIGQALGQKGRVARENWIEQAQILARGGQTLFSRAARPGRGQHGRADAR